MTILSIIKRKLTESRFRRKNLNIIESIEPEHIQLMLDDLVAQGWELAPQFDSAASLSTQGMCIVRRGQSTLTFAFSPTLLGSVVGPARIVAGLAREYELSALTKPS